jgi:uncharacterized protein (TIGR03067 family)
MRLLLFVGLTFTLVLGVASMVPAGDQTDDAKLIQGTWVVDPNAYKDVKDQEVVKEMKAVRVVFKGDSCTFKHPPGIEEKGSFRLDPSKKPKQIDLLSDMGTVRAQGIYELQKDHLKLCWDRQFKTQGRPTKFAHAKEGNDPFLLVLIREKK